MAATIMASPVRRVERDVLGDLALPPVAVREQALLVVVEFLPGLCRKLEIRAFDDGIDRAGLLAQTAIDALDHVDIVARGAPRSVAAARAGFNRDRLGGTDRLAELAGNTAFLAVGITAQRMLAAKSGRERPLFERIIQRRLGLEKIA